MTDEAEERKLFAEGFIAGWRSIPDVSPPMPPHIPQYKLPPGKPPFEQGYELGRALAAGK